jgi:hypothetical protein
MPEQNYLQIQNNVVTNIVYWDGETDWTPPADAIMLVQATTPAMVWGPNDPTAPTAWVLTEVIGAGAIGFTWNGTVLTTNEPEPSTPPVPIPPAKSQIKTTGTVAA